jgi:hypothetical protein
LEAGRPSAVQWDDVHVKRTDFEWPGRS